MTAAGEESWLPFTLLYRMHALGVGDIGSLPACDDAGEVRNGLLRGTLCEYRDLIDRCARGTERCPHKG